MFAQEPNLQFVGAQNIADDQIVRAIVSEFGGAPCQLPTMTDDDLVCVEKAGNLNGHLFPAARRTLDACRLGYIGSHWQRDSTEQMKPLGNFVDDLNLLAQVFVEQQMQLIEGGPCDLPMRFLVEIA